MTQLTNKQTYETRLADGSIYGAIGPRDWDRFRQTLKYVPSGVSSLLDAGCDRGHWLSYACSKRRLSNHLGVDVSEGRIAEAKTQYPHLNFKAGYLEELGIEPRSYDVVTCLEVLEHIPEWEAVLHALLRVAARHVIVTVPYRERILSTVCIHCGKLAPMYGHLRSYDETTFPQVPGWNLSFGYIRDYGIGYSLVRRTYYLVKPKYGWLVARYAVEMGGDRSSGA